MIVDTGNQGLVSVALVIWRKIAIALTGPFGPILSLRTGLFTTSHQGGDEAAGLLLRLEKRLVHHRIFVTLLRFMRLITQSRTMPIAAAPTSEPVSNPLIQPLNHIWDSVISSPP